MDEAPALELGDTGEFVVDLHAQLTIAGYPVETVHPDRFERPTLDAVVAAHHRRLATHEPITEVMSGFGQ